MKSTQITPTVTQLTKFGLINAYLVREEDGFTLIDTTMSAADDILAAATAGGAEIRRIVLTHGHGDHVGSLDALHDRLGEDVPVHISELDAKILRGEPVDFGPGGQKRGSWPKLTTTPSAFLTPGQRIASLEVIAAPGHTPGQVAFLDTRDNTLIAGDAFSAVGGLAVPNHPHWRFPLPWFATANRDQALESAVTLADRKPSVLAMGHGAALKDPAAAIDAAIVRARRAAA